jgi:hypothetical protein
MMIIFVVEVRHTLKPVHTATALVLSAKWARSV